MDQSPSPSPSARSHRHRLSWIAGVGLVVATYLTLFQVGVLDAVWDPVFGDGTRKVLALTEPVPDAAAGVVAYAAEIGLNAIGGDQRWRTQPLVVLLLGALFLSGAVVSVALIAVQALVVGHWCLLCLVSAAVSFVLLALGAPEVLAALAHVRAERGRRHPRDDHPPRAPWAGTALTSRPAGRTAASSDRRAEGRRR